MLLVWLLATLAMQTAPVSPAPFSTPTPPPPPPATTPVRYYLAALARMKETREPKFALYHASIDVQNGTVFARRMPNGVLYLRIANQYDGPTHAEFSIFTSSGNPTYAAKPQGYPVAATRLSLLNATWSGLYDWIRYGFEGDPSTGTPPPASALAARAASKLRIISIVSSFGLAYYNVADGGERRCANGDRGREMILSPLGDEYAHPLRGATIDEDTGLFCTMHFIAPVVAGPAFGAAGADVTVHLAQFQGYYLAQDERIDIVGEAREGQVDRVVSIIRFDRFSFPDRI